MKRRDLVRHLRAHGCEFLREGGNHSVYVNRAKRRALRFLATEMSMISLRGRYAGISTSPNSTDNPSVERPADAAAHLKGRYV